MENEQQQCQKYYERDLKNAEVSKSAVNALVMRITTQKGMVNIDNDEIAYGDIRNMYITGNGCGLQLSERLEHKRGEIIDICSDIADRIYRLQDILSA